MSQFPVFPLFYCFMFASSVFNECNRTNHEKWFSIVLVFDFFLTNRVYATIHVKNFLKHLIGFRCVSC
ncbi:hypothetical protein L1887_26076 [Cichorium endivia]|nr:hypothetical protein L1887_26076 [Cichorium endivia]